MRTIRNVVFALLLLTIAFTPNRSYAFGCSSVSYFSYGAYYSWCGPHAGEFTGCGFLTNDCQALCWYAGQWAGYLSSCTPHLVDEMSDEWYTDATCQCNT
jgi:hypothetical protein